MQQELLSGSRFKTPADASPRGCGALLTAVTMVPAASSALGLARLPGLPTCCLPDGWGTVWRWFSSAASRKTLQLVVEVDLHQAVLVLVRAPRLALDLQDII